MLDQTDFGLEEVVWTQEELDRRERERQIRRKEIIYPIFDHLSRKIFPEKGWMDELSRVKSDAHLDTFLAQHLDDDEWLAGWFLNAVVRERGRILEIEEAKEYVSSSVVFNEQKRKFVENVVKWQIESQRAWETTFVDPEIYGYMWFFREDCDKVFRQHILDCLMGLGMNKQMVEVAVEKLSYLWLDDYVDLAYMNAFDPKQMYWDKTRALSNNPLMREHRTCWVKLRKIEYIEEHLEAIKKAGVEFSEKLLEPSLRQELERKVKTVEELGVVEWQHREPQGFRKKYLGLLENLNEDGFGSDNSESDEN